MVRTRKIFPGQIRPLVGPFLPTNPSGQVPLLSSPLIIFQLPNKRIFIWAYSLIIYSITRSSNMVNEQKVFRFIY